MAIVVGIGARPPKLLALLSRHVRASTQLPVRISLVMLATLFLLATPPRPPGTILALATILSPFNTAFF